MAFLLLLRRTFIHGGNFDYMTRILICMAAILCFAPVAARGDVSVFVMESLGVAGEFTGSGHTAVYFSNICAESPTQLRICKPGEQGAVISSYPSFGDDVEREWIAVPILGFLYGIDDESDMPLYANGKIRLFLRDNFRQTHMRDLIPDSPDGAIPEGGWKKMLTTGFNRDIYSFNIRTTPEEDLQFLARFRERPVDGEFKAFTRNCADFTKKVINSYFPGAAKKDFINDFGITTPKAVARSVSRYATKRPDRQFNIVKYSQIHGPIWRSSDNRNFTEKALVSKKYLVPSLTFYPPIFVGFAAAYLTTGRFSVAGTYKKYAGPEMARLNFQESTLKKSKDRSSAAKLTLAEIAKKKEAERLTLLGDRRTWMLYRSYFDPIVKRAIRDGYFRDMKEVKSFFRDLELQSEPAKDEDGGLILKVDNYGMERTLGLTRSNIMDSRSDRELAFKLVIAKIYADLNAKDKDRSSLIDFRENWHLLGQLAAELSSNPERLATLKGRGPFLKSPPPRDLGRSLQKAFIAVTQ